MAERRVRSDPRLKLPPGPGLRAEDVAAHQTARIQAALIEVVAERGYEKLKVRDLVKEAKVSTKAFYERYASKEDCFLQTCDLLTRRAMRRLVAAQIDGQDWRGRLRLVLGEFARELRLAPAAAHFVLVEAYAADLGSRERAWRSERHFKGMLAESLARPPGGVAVPSLVVEGMVAGAVHVARNRLSAGRADDLEQVTDDLAQWAQSCVGASAATLEELDGQDVWRNTMHKPLSETASERGGGTWPPTGDRALILSAVARLAVADGYAKLTVARIRAASGVSRGKFDDYFDSVDACYVAAFEGRAAEALAQAARAQTAARSWSGGIYRAIAALCECIAGDPFLADACLADEFPSGSEVSRARGRLADAVLEQLGDSVPRDLRPGSAAAEASAGAVWGVFHHHMIRDWVKRRRIAASLSYLALAPLIGAPAAIAAIRAEQSG